MAGFDNDVVYAANVDFRGVKPVVGQVTTDGQLLIGSTASPHIKVSTLTSTDTSLTITNGSGTIDIAGPVFKTITNISSAQILAMNVTPVTIVAAPGAGKLICPISVTVILDFNTIPYDVSGGGTAYISYAAVPDFLVSYVWQIPAIDFFNESVDSVYLLTSDAFQDSAAVSVNQALRMFFPNGPYVNGNSPIRVLSVYSILDTGL